MRPLLIILTLIATIYAKERKDTVVVYLFKADTIMIVKTYNDTSILVSEDTLSAVKEKKEETVKKDKKKKEK